YIATRLYSTILPAGQDHPAAIRRRYQPHQAHCGAVLLPRRRRHSPIRVLDRRHVISTHIYPQTSNWTFHPTSRERKPGAVGCGSRNRNHACQQSVVAADASNHATRHKLQLLPKQQFFRASRVVCLAASIDRKTVGQVEASCLGVRRIVHAVAQCGDGDLSHTQRS
ncbi:hypothetical protein LCGC14_2031840, partial [marine sediment metagenome]